MKVTRLTNKLAGDHLDNSIVLQLEGRLRLPYDSLTGMLLF